MNTETIDDFALWEAEVAAQEARLRGLGQEALTAFDVVAAGADSCPPPPSRTGNPSSAPSIDPDDTDFY